MRDVALYREVKVLRRFGSKNRKQCRHVGWTMTEYQQYTAVKEGGPTSVEEGVLSVPVTAPSSSAGGMGGFSLANVMNGASFETAQGAIMTAWSRTRPWKEFANTKAMSMPTMTELRDRMQENFVYYMYNYAIILLVFSVVAVLSNPLSLLCIAGIFLGYMYLFVYDQNTVRVLLPFNKPERIKTGCQRILNESTEAQSSVLFYVL